MNTKSTQTLRETKRGKGSVGNGVDAAPAGKRLLTFVRFALFLPTPYDLGTAKTGLATQMA